jgi:hypothetical protein
VTSEFLTTTLRGSIPSRGRRPKRDDTRRRCSMEHCDTVLSRYNLAETCRAHTPINFPRIRGEISTE